MLRDSYKHLLGIPYSSGRDDCYGLMRRYFSEVFGLQLLNVARPDGWWNDPSIDLINETMYGDGWQPLGLNTRALKVGDGLIFSLINGRANHVGVYVGNGMFLHHVYGRFSSEDALLDKWTSRLLSIVRHPSMEEIQKKNQITVDILTLLPERLRARIIRPT